MTHQFAIGSSIIQHTWSTTHWEVKQIPYPIKDPAADVLLLTRIGLQPTAATGN